MAIIFTFDYMIIESQKKNRLDLFYRSNLPETIHFKNEMRRFTNKGVQRNSKGETEGRGAKFKRNNLFFVKSLTKCPKRGGEG